MKLLAFAVLDIATEHFNTPFFAKTRREGMRIFDTVARDTSSKLNQHPHDFRLYEIGTYDDQTAAFQNSGMHDLGTAASFLVDQHNVDVLYPQKEGEK